MTVAATTATLEPTTTSCTRPETAPTQPTKTSIVLPLLLSDVIRLGTALNEAPTFEILNVTTNFSATKNDSTQSRQTELAISCQNVFGGKKLRYAREREEKSPK